MNRNLLAISCVLFLFSSQILSAEKKTKNSNNKTRKKVVTKKRNNNEVSNNAKKKIINQNKHINQNNNNAKKEEKPTIQEEKPSATAHPRSGVIKKEEKEPRKPRRKKVEKEDEEIETLMTVDEVFDPQAKRKAIMKLIERGIEFIKKNEMKIINNAFSRSDEFVEGELYLFLLDRKGIVFAHGHLDYLLWDNLWDLRDTFGSPFVQTMIETAKKGGGWVTYEWRGSIKVSYVQEVVKDGKEFIIGSGYYSHSKADSVVGLVKGAVALFNQVIEEGRPVEDAFSALSYPLSERFVFGDLYLYSLDFDGTIRAQGDRPGLIGSNALEYKSKGKFVNKEIIAALKEKDPGEGVWVDYFSKNTKKLAYAEKVSDAKGNWYFIACGYYPDVDRDETVDLVRRGYQFMKASGISAAKKEFTDKRIQTFRFGDLYLFVYDLEGKVIAHGGNEDLVGQNHYDLQDEDGRYYVRELISQAKAGGGWVDFKMNNSFQSTYVELVDMGVDKFIICSGLFPVSKEETMALLVKSAVGFLKTRSNEEAFRRMVERGGEFIRGDLFVFALDNEGYCYAWGDEYNLIWKNLIDWKDENGKPFIKAIINTARSGPGKLTYHMSKRPRITYFEQLEKDGVTYTIGSGFYK